MLWKISGLWKGLVFIACIMLVVVAGFVVLAGIRLRRAAPKHWLTARGEWVGPALRHAPQRYQYRTPDGSWHEGTTRVKVFWRPPHGGLCQVAYDPANPARSQPAQLRLGGTVLIGTGILAAVAGVVLLAIALA